MKYSEQLQKTLDILKGHPDREGILKRLADPRFVGENNNPQVSIVINKIKDRSRDLDEIIKSLIPWLQIKVFRARLIHKL